MRIKTYTAASVPEAMNLIRKDFGSNAVILSNQRTIEGVRLTVGLEDVLSENEINEALFGPKEEQTFSNIQNALQQHGTPPLLIERILLSAQDVWAGQNDETLLTMALQNVFKFSPLPNFLTKRAFILVGASGVGKTIAVAKMAVKAKIAGKKVAVITTDIKRAGAIEQLEAFTKILELPLIKVRKPDLLKSTIDNVRPSSDLILIDSPGINPFLQEDIEFLQNMKKGIDGLEAVLVLSAGADAYESAEIAEAFLPLGCIRIMATRLDLSRRLGNILFAAQSNGYALTDVGISPRVSEGLCPLKASALAELILLKVKKEGRV